jgi:FkbM family methyltransferase
MLDTALVRIGELIGKPPGWERVVRTLAPPNRFAHSSIQTRQQSDGYLFPVDRGTLIGWSIHFFGTYEPEVQAEIRRHLKPGDVAVDVGANVGWHALLMAARVGPTGRVYAFEPNDSTRRRLVGAVDANRLLQVTVDSRGLADRAGARGFEAPPAGHVWDGTGHMTVEQEGRERQEGQAGQEGKTRTIDCTTLDSFAVERKLHRLALLKIDVEGFELPVLLGARQVLAALRPAVVFEYDPAYVGRSGGTSEDLMRCWSEADYELFVLDRRRPPAPTAELGPHGGNFLALPRGGTK